MNFSDFGVKDESELEQDEFSLSRPTFGEYNQLTVIGWKGKYPNSHKHYIVKCSKCSKDQEMFGDGIFKTSKHSLTKGYAPCGCSYSPRWTEDQYKTLIERKCKEVGYIFHGFVGNLKDNRTKLKLECPKHGMYESTNINNFLNFGCKCPKCKTDKLIRFNTLENLQHINSFLSTGKFKEGTKFWRSERLNTQGGGVYWNYTCPVCSNDEYVKAGLCSGVFETASGDLQRGILSCRCALRFHWTKEQYEYRIKKKMQESKTTDEFIGFVGSVEGSISKFTRKCRLHGEYATSINNFLNEGCSCPRCANQNQQECYINFIKDKETLIALKIGIAKDSEQRIKKQNSKSGFSVEQYGVWSFPDVKDCKAAEKFIKQNLKCKVLTKQEMPDGYTETTSTENLETIIKIYEDFGGVRKIIESEILLEDKSL